MHRVKQISNLGVGPNERALNIWQANTAELDLIQQRGQRVVDLTEFRITHRRLTIVRNEDVNSHDVHGEYGVDDLESLFVHELAKAFMRFDQFLTAL